MQPFEFGGEAATDVAAAGWCGCKGHVGAAIASDTDTAGVGVGRANAAVSSQSLFYVCYFYY